MNQDKYNTTLTLVYKKAIESRIPVEYVMTLFDRASGEFLITSVHDSLVTLIEGDIPVSIIPSYFPNLERDKLALVYVILLVAKEDGVLSPTQEDLANINLLLERTSSTNMINEYTLGDWYTTMIHDYVHQLEIDTKNAQRLVVITKLIEQFEPMRHSDIAIQRKMKRGSCVLNFDKFPELTDGIIINKKSMVRTEDNVSINYQDLEQRLRQLDQENNSDKEDPIDVFSLAIFDRSSVSSEVPLISYISPSGGFNKLYYQGITEGMDMGVFTSIPEISGGKMAIAANVWSGAKGSTRTKKITKNQFAPFYLETSHNICYYTIPVHVNSNDKIIEEKIEASIPIRIKDKEELGVSGESFIFGFYYNESSFNYMVLNDPVISQFMYVEEKFRPYSLKRGTSYHFRSIEDIPIRDINLKEEGKSHDSLPGSMTFQIQQFFSLEEEVISLRTRTFIPKEIDELPNSSGRIGDIEQFIVIPKSTPYVKVHIVRATDELEALKNIELLARILQYTQRLRDTSDPWARISNIIPSAEVVRTDEGSKMKYAVNSFRSNLIMMRLATREFLQLSLKSDCPRSHLPLPIFRYEEDEWNNIPFFSGGKLNDRQIMYYPNPSSNSASHPFVCPNDDYAFPGVTVNKVLSSVSQYPYVPCCFREDQTLPSTQTYYNAYYHDVEVKTRGKLDKPNAKGTIKITKKMVPLNHMGRVHGETEKILMTALKDVVNYGDVAVVRIGNIRGRFSFLTSVLLALDDNGIRSVQHDLARTEAYCVQVLQNMISKVNLECMKQELYELSREDIMSQLSQWDSVDLDSWKHYRLLEEFFDINIFVYLSDDLEIPRHRLCHLRRVEQDRTNTVVLLKMKGTMIQTSNYAHYEILSLQSTEGSFLRQVFGERTRDKLIELMGLRHNIIHKDLLNNVSTLNTFPFPYEVFEKNDFVLLSQFIDRYGKCRGLNITNGTEFTIFFPPTQPFNLPLADIIEADQDQVLATFGEPSSVEAHGYWYSIGEEITEGFFIPTEPNVVEEFSVVREPKGASRTMIPKYQKIGDLLGERPQVYEKMKFLSNQLSTLVQLLIWLYLHYEGSVEQFVDGFFQLSVSRGQIVLPAQGSFLSKCNNVMEALRYLGRITKNLILKNKVVFESQGLLDNMKYMLHTFAKEHEYQLISPKMRIENTDMMDTMFEKAPGTIVVSATDSQGEWEAMIHSFLMEDIGIIEKIEEDTLYKKAPSFIRINGNYYILQTVFTGDSTRAYSNGESWALSHVNRGFYSPPIDVTGLLAYEGEDILNGTKIPNVVESAVAINDIEILRSGLTLEGITAAELRLRVLSYILNVQILHFDTNGNYARETMFMKDEVSILVGEQKKGLYFSLLPLISTSSPELEEQ